MPFSWVPSASDTGMNLNHYETVSTRLTESTSFSLIKHPKLMQICREKNIAVETCPISYAINSILLYLPYEFGICIVQQRDPREYNTVMPG